MAGPIDGTASGTTVAGTTTGTTVAGTASDTDGPDTAAVLARVRFDDRGLVPAIIQQDGTREVLMMGWMDAEAVRRTLTTGRTTFWSRSRREYWRKGDTSGHAQYVRAAALDCDGDTLLITVDQVGVACHTGTRTCFDGDPVEAVVGSAVAHDTAAHDTAVHDTAAHDAAAHETTPNADGPRA